jgi:iron complex outermembrane receptor protein
VSTGFKGGGVNPRPYYVIQIRPFNPETVTAYELGMKSAWFERKLRLNLSAYQNKYKDVQLSLLSCPQYVPTGSAPNCSMPSNVGDATIQGLEAELEVHPVSGLMVDASASYTDFQYDDVNASTKVGIDMKPPYTPRLQGAFGIQYEMPLGAQGSLTPRFDFSYKSEVYTDPINTAANHLPGRGVANARLTYQSGSGDWEAALAVTNLFDKYYYINLYERAPPTTNSYQLVSGQPARPREWVFQLKRKF